MILFCLNHIGHISKVLTLRYTTWKDQPCALLVEGMKLQPYFSAMVETKMFDAVIPFYNVSGGQTDLSQLKEDVLTYYNKLAERHGIDWHQYDEIISISDRVDFISSYFVLKGIPFSKMEAGVKDFMNPELYLLKGQEEIESKEPMRQLFLETKSLSGEDGICCNKRYLDPNGTLQKESDELFDFSKVFFTLDIESKAAITKTFSVSLPKGKKNLLLLGSDGAKAYMQSLKEPFPKDLHFVQNECRLFFLDLIACDLFCSPEVPLIVKKHPMSFPYPFDCVFADYLKLDPVVPTELMSFQDDFSFDMVLGTSISAVSKISHCVHQSIELHYEYMRHFDLLLKFMIATEVLQQLHRIHSMALFGIPDSFAEILYTHTISLQEESLCLKERAEIHSDDHCFVAAVAEAEHSDFLLFLKQTQALVIFFDARVFAWDDYYKTDDFLVHCVRKTMGKTRNTKTLGVAFCPLEEEYLYFYSKDAVVLEQISQIDLLQQYHHTDITVSVTSETCDTWKDLQKQGNILFDICQYRKPLPSKLPFVYENVNLVLWGTGVAAGFMADVFQSYGKEISYFCDNKKEKWGTHFHGVEILSPDSMKLREDILIQIACDTPYDQEIEDQLKHIGIKHYVTRNAFYGYFESEKEKEER